MQKIHLQSPGGVISYWGWPFEDVANPAYDSDDLVDSIEGAPLLNLMDLAPGQALASARHGLRHRTGDGNWLVAARLERAEEQWRITDIRVRAWPEGHSSPTHVTSTALRQVRVRELADVAKAILQENGRRLVTLAPPGDGVWAAWAEKEIQFSSADPVRPTPVGRPRTSAEQARVVAHLWLRFEADRPAGQSMYGAIADALSAEEGHISANQVRTRLRCAEDLKLISKGQVGRRRRTPGPNLERPSEDRQ